MNVGKGYILLGTLLGFPVRVGGFRIECNLKHFHANPPTVYDHEAVSLYENETIPMSRYSGDILLIVNVATF